MEKINELSLKLKNGLIDNLMNSPRDLDVVYMCCGVNTYSRRELATEIQNETEFGLEMIINCMSATMDVVSRQSLINK